VNWPLENTEATKTTRMLRHASRCVNASSRLIRGDDSLQVGDTQYLKGISAPV
jgi:hypothetical protein